MPSAMEKVNRWYGANGSPTEVRYFPEAASQTFKRGDLVYLVSGKVTVAAAVGANVGAITILGIAEADATGTTDTMLPVAIANANLRWVLPMSTASGGIGSSQVTAVTQVGSKYEVSRIAAAKWAVDVSANTNAMIVVTSIPPQYAVGEAWGWVECQFLDAAVDVRV